jgi:hypothetical protein
MHRELSLFFQGYRRSPTGLENEAQANHHFGKNLGQWFQFETFFALAPPKIHALFFPVQPDFHVRCLT